MKMIWKSIPQDQGYKVVMECKGKGSFSTSKEDRVLNIPDLLEYTTKPYNNSKYGDNILEIKDCNTGVGTFKLFAVFDGHCGAIASTYCAHRFPHQLVSQPAFALGEYEQALTDTFHDVHRELLKCEVYRPEKNTNFSSGATASVVLVTPSRTFFSSLGDSPILLFKKGTQLPKQVFQEHDALNTLVIDNLRKSNAFLIMFKKIDAKQKYFIVDRPSVLQHVFRNLDSKCKKKPFEEYIVQNEDVVFKEIEFDSENEVSDDNEHAEEDFLPSLAFSDLKKPGSLFYDDVRVGLSALNVHGSIGDSSQDPEVLNTFINCVLSYRAFAASKHRKQEEVKVETSEDVGRSSGVLPSLNFLPFDLSVDTLSHKEEEAKPLDQNYDVSMFDYTEFRNFMLGCPEWDFLKKHFTLPEKEKKSSRVLTSFIHSLSESSKIKFPTLLRTPVHYNVANSEVNLFIIASDGVIRFYDYFHPSYQNMILKNYNNPHKIVHEMMGYVRWLEDDRSCICIKYPGADVREDVDCVEIVGSKDMYRMMMTVLSKM